MGGVTITSSCKLDNPLLFKLYVLMHLCMLVFNVWRYTSERLFPPISQAGKTPEIVVPDNSKDKALNYTEKRPDVCKRWHDKVGTNHSQTQTAQQHSEFMTNWTIMSEQCTRVCPWQVSEKDMCVDRFTFFDHTLANRVKMLSSVGYFRLRDTKPLQAGDAPYFAGTIERLIVPAVEELLVRVDFAPSKNTMAHWQDNLLRDYQHLVDFYHWFTKPKEIPKKVRTIILDSRGIPWKTSSETHADLTMGQIMFLAQGHGAVINVTNRSHPHVSYQTLTSGAEVSVQVDCFSDDFDLRSYMANLQKHRGTRTAKAELYAAKVLDPTCVMSFTLVESNAMVVEPGNHTNFVVKYYFILKTETGVDVSRIPDLNTLIIHVVTVVVLAALPNTIISIFALNCLGLLSTIYRRVVLRPFAFRTAISSTAVHILTSSAIFSLLGNPGDEDPMDGAISAALSSSEGEQGAKGKISSISRDKVSEILCRAAQHRGISLNEEEANSFADFCFVYMAGGGKRAKAFGLLGSTEVVPDTDIDEDRFNTACTSEDTMDLTSILYLFKRQRGFLNPLEKLFMPPEFYKSMKLGQKLITAVDWTSLSTTKQEQNDQNFDPEVLLQSQELSQSNQLGHLPSGKNDNVVTRKEGTAPRVQGNLYELRDSMQNFRQQIDGVLSQQSFFEGKLEQLHKETEEARAQEKKLLADLQEELLAERKIRASLMSRVSELEYQVHASKCAADAALEEAQNSRKTAEKMNEVLQSCKQEYKELAHEFIWKLEMKRAARSHMQAVKQAEEDMSRICT